MNEEQNKVESFNVPFTPQYSIDLKTDSINSNLARQDKRTVIYDNDSASYSASSIMMGYNKENYTLGDGQFVNADELISAINNAISQYETGTVVVNRSTKKVLNVNAFVKMLKEAKGALILGTRSNAVTNQDTRTLKIESTDGRQSKKGVLFLGNRGLQLGTGEYVSLDEFRKAINDYIVVSPTKTVTPKPEPVPEQKTVLNEKNVVRVVKRFKNKASVWLAILGSVAVLASGFSQKNNMQNIKVPDDVINSIQNETGQKDLYFEIDGIVYEYEPSDSTLRRTTENLTLGGQLNVDDGKTFNTNSLETGVSKTIGQDFSKEGKYAGDYRITGFSIINNGNILNYIEDFNGLNDTTKLKDILDKTLTENNLNYEDVQIKVHLGTINDYSRLGWIDITELVNANTITEDMINKVANRISVDKGIKKDFSGNYLTISNGVTLKITDENGHLLTSGSTVIGLDGKEYIINDLSLSGGSKVDNNGTMNSDNENKEVSNGTHLSWSITDCNLALGIAPLLAATALGIANKKKNDRSQKNPNFFEFKNDEEYLKFKKEFEAAKDKYEKSSKFNQVLKKVFLGEKIDVMQKLSSEQVNELYSSIMKHAGKDFVFGVNDKISIKDGKILVTYKDGHYTDITDIVMPDIYSIGQSNEIVAEGHLR